MKREKRKTANASKDIPSPERKGAAGARLLSTSSSVVDLFCQKCGYNLRGNESERCPECGAAADLDALSQPQIPWVYRKGRGLFRAYWQTVWLVMFHPRRLHEEMSRDIGEDHARKFRRATLLCVVLPSLLVINGVYYVGVITGSLLLDLTIALSVFGTAAVALACVWVFMWAISSIAGDFLRDDRIAPEMQDRAVALSYYTCAPMLGMPLVGLINILAQIPGNGLILGSTFEMAAILVAGGLPLVLMGLWVHSVLTLARYVLHLSLWEQIRFEATQIVLWLGTAIATLVVLPLTIVWLLAVVLSFY